MMKRKYNLTAAGNTIAPTYYLLIEKGYSIALKDEYWFAENDTVRISADDLLALAGLVSLYEQKGESWQIEDQQIAAFIEKFDLGFQE